MKNERERVMSKLGWAIMKMCYGDSQATWSVEEYAQKYAELSAKNKRLKAKNKKLRAENKQLYNRLLPFMTQEGTI